MSELPRQGKKLNHPHVPSREVKLAIFAHCTIDTINLKGITYEQIGGSACYCGITAREFKFDVELHTRFGDDFPSQYLLDHKINLVGAHAQSPTTRFSIEISNADRVLKLENRCDDIQYDSTSADGFLVSPICNEISHDVFSRIKRDASFVLTDPQGFLRAVDLQKNIFLKKTCLDLSGIDAIKVNCDEGMHITGNTGDEMAKSLQKRGVKHVIFTDKTKVSMLVEDKIYSITLPNKEVHDTTGIGDIFCSTFCCTMLKEKDFLWALCFAGGAAQAALNSKQIGLKKIPKKGEIETNASYFYNLVKFRTV